jgi:hypothetical protein
MSGRIATVDAVAGERLTIWVGSASGGVWKSTDGGLDFKPVFDKHTQSIGAVDIDPKDPKTVTRQDLEAGPRGRQRDRLRRPRQNPQELLLGTDGAVYQSRDRGDHWRFVGSMPVSQFYHVSYDMEWPYNVYGGLQDNSTWMAPSRHPGGIKNRHWKVLGYGDGFWAFVDPSDPDLVYVEYQGGNLLRQRKSTGEIKEIKPLEREGDAKYRFNWNTPIHISPTRPGTIYYGAQFLFRSTDRVQLTRDGNKTWTNVTVALVAAGVPKATWVSRPAAPTKPRPTRPSTAT